MVSRSHSYFLDRDIIASLLAKEESYSKQWAETKESSVAGIPAHACSRSTGLPYDNASWIIFAEKYLNEAKLALAGFTPDSRAVRIRILKAASCLVTALQVHGANNDYTDIAGVSSSKYPVGRGSLVAALEAGQAVEIVPAEK